MTKLKPNQILLDGHLITEIPLLFQTEMVKANLEDRKTQTRRMNGLKYLNDPEYLKSVTLMRMDYNIDNYRCLKVFRNGDVLNSTVFKSPYGKPGDLLWVRETWLKLDPDHYCTNPYQYTAQGDFNIFTEALRKSYIEMGYNYNWKPSIHMPKSASRIWAMVEEIRVERVQDISEKDAKAEGCIQYEKDTDWMTAKYGYQILWESINGQESWNSNPWVWVIKYRILSKTGRPSDEVILKNHLEITGQLTN